MTHAHIAIFNHLYGSRCGVQRSLLTIAFTCKECSNGGVICELTEGPCPACSIAYSSRGQGARSSVSCPCVFTALSWGWNQLVVSKKLFQSVLRFKLLKHSVIILLVIFNKMEGVLFTFRVEFCQINILNIFNSYTNM